MTIPLYRGFNLTDRYTAEHHDQPSARFLESDFAIIAAWGFNFVRLPLSYRTWSSGGDPFTIHEPALAPIDQAIEWGRQYGIHVNLCFHRIPGYCINPDRTEPFDLFDRRLFRNTHRCALDAAAFHWRYFAERYRGIDNTRLSFDLLNEPPGRRRRYERIVRRLVHAIREADPSRLIFIDGLDVGATPVWSIADLGGVVQSTRGYQPRALTHYQANWVSPGEYSHAGPPTWPLPPWDKERVRERTIEPWRKLAASGVPVHVGEWGCYNATPHRTALQWMRDMLDLWAEAGWGWALWNLRGPFGVLDSGRADVAYERVGAHQLDRHMLELLKHP